VNRLAVSRLPGCAADPRPTGPPRTRRRPSAGGGGAGIGPGRRPHERRRHEKREGAGPGGRPRVGRIVPIVVLLASRRRVLRDLRPRHRRRVEDPRRSRPRRGPVLSRMSSRIPFPVLIASAASSVALSYPMNGVESGDRSDRVVDVVAHHVDVCGDPLDAVDAERLRAFMNIVCASKMQAAITGSKTLSWSCPPSAARETVRSLPMTRKQTM